jgi:Mrp family chromosome partitioning ATPase
MAPTKQAQSTFGYIQRGLEDEYVQEQLRAAVGGLRTAYTRARKQRAQATEDKRLYRSLRQAATAVRNAGTALRPPEPEPKHRIRKVLVVGAAAGGTALLTSKLQKAQQRGTSEPA